MSLFRSKKKEQTLSAFDQIPDEAQAKLIEDVLTIVRTLKEWPNIIPKELHQAIGNELQAMLRKSLSKLIPMFMTDGDMDFGKAFEGVHMPMTLKQMFLAIRLGLVSPPIKPIPPEDDPNGTAA